MEGGHEAFYSNPSIKYLLALLHLCEKGGCYKKEIDSAITRINSLLEETKKRRETYFVEDCDLRKASADEDLLVKAYLLAGRLEDALNLCSNKGALGWNYGTNPKGLVLPFLLKLLSEGKYVSPVHNVEHLWKDAINSICRYSSSSENISKRFQQAMDKVFRSIKLPSDEKRRHIQWCVKEAEWRIDAIVGEKHRKSYHKAATLLVATAEILANQYKKSEGDALLEKYRQKYHRYSSFRQELQVAIGRSKIFT